MDERLAAISADQGVFLRSEAEALGYNDKAIARLVRSGEWHRVRHGAYVGGAVWAGLDERGRYALVMRAVLRQARTPVVLSHTSAIAEYGAPLWALDLSRVHLTRLDGRTGRRERGVQQHQGLLLPGDSVRRNQVPVTAATRACLELTTVADTEPCLCVLDDMLHRGLTSLEELAARYASMSFWPNTLHTDLILRLADGRSESVGETRSRYLCWRHGLPAPVPQFEIKDASGRVVARVDLAWPERGVFLEFDGRVKYEALLRHGESATDVVLREKRREELICELTGWRCIRLVWADLERPERTAARIRHVLQAGATAA